MKLYFVAVSWNEVNIDLINETSKRQFYKYNGELWISLN